jgi:hypothetical protein
LPSDPDGISTEMQRGFVLNPPRSRVAIHDVPVESEVRRRRPRNDASFKKRDTMSRSRILSPTQSSLCGARACRAAVMFKIAAQVVPFSR